MSISKKQEKKERLKELIWFICENYNQHLYETKLWKLAFFCDSDYFEKYGESLTNVAYIKNKRGPTPSYDIAKVALDELVQGGYIMKNENGSYVATKGYEVKKLEQHQLDAISATCDKYYRLSVNQICTLAHRDPVYLAAEEHNDILDLKFVAYRDDGSNEQEEDDKPTEVSFSEKAKKNLLKVAFA